MRRTMRLSLTFLLPLGIATVFLGCTPTSTMTQGSYDSPDGKYRVWVRTISRYGHGHEYADQTRKCVRISLVELISAKTNWNESPLFTKDYHFKCSDVIVAPSWDKDDNLTAVIYDYAPGVYWQEALKAGSPSNYIATVSFVLDKLTGIIHEERQQIKRPAMR